MKQETEAIERRKQASPLEKVFTAQTPAGFKVQVKLTGIIRIPGTTRLENAIYHIDDKWPANTPVVTNQDIRIMRERYVRAFQWWLAGSSRFYAYGWTSASKRMDIIATPHVWDYRLVEEPGEEQRLVIDLGGVDTKNEANEQLDLSDKGCSVYLELVTSGYWSDELKEENFRMIDPRMLEELKKDERYRVYDEVTAVMAIRARLEAEKELLAIEEEYEEKKKRMRKEQTDKEHGKTAHHFRVKTELLGGSLQLTWQCKGGYEGSHIVGYCKRGRAFPKAQYRDGNYQGFDGDHLVDTIEDGNRVIRAEPGWEYSFTFARLKHGIFRRTEVADYINFSVVVPMPASKQEDIDELNLNIKKEELKARLKALCEPKSERDEINQALRKFLKEVNRESELTSLADELERKEKRRREQQVRAACREDGASEIETEIRVREGLDRVAEFYKMLRMEYLR